MTLRERLAEIRWRHYHFIFDDYEMGNCTCGWIGHYREHPLHISESEVNYLREHLVDHAEELGLKVDRRPSQIYYWDRSDLNRGSTRLVTDWKKA